MQKLLVVSLDTYRKDNLGRVVNGVPISPFMSGIMKEGVFYNNYFASCNWTIPSYASMFTGEPTISHNFWGVKRFPGQPVDLIFDTLLTAEIWPSLICVGVLAEADIFKYRSNRYFATNYDPFKLDGTIDLIVRRLEESDFVFFHTFLMHDYMHHYTYDSHRHGITRPYLFIDRQQSEVMGEKMKRWREEHFPMLAEDLRSLEAMYWNECLLVDGFMKTLFDVVMSRFPDLEIIINADHGECFSNCGKKAFDGNWHRTEWPLWHHSTGFCREQFEVFAIRYNSPGSRPGKVIDDLMDHEDVYHMIMNKFGLAAPRLGGKTYNIISTSYDRVGFCGILEAGEVYLFDRNNDFRFLLSDNLYTNEFPDPDTDRIVRYREILRSRSREVECYAEATDEVRSRLKGFGYL
jgi:hypothetical protein